MTDDAHDSPEAIIRYLETFSSHVALFNSVILQLFFSRTILSFCALRSVRVPVKLCLTRISQSAATQYFGSPLQRGLKNPYSSLPIF